MNLDNLWNSFLEKIKNEIANISYDTWFAETKLIDLKDNVATVLVPYPSQKKMLVENYKDIIEEIFTEVTGSNFIFNYVIEEEIENSLNINNQVIGVPTNKNFDSN